MPFQPAYELNISELWLMLIFATLRADWPVQASNGMAKGSSAINTRNIFFFKLNFTWLDERQNES